jgi:phage protein D
MHPIINITVAGKTVSSGFYSRLVSASVTDKEGVTSDTFQMELNDGPPDFVDLPTPGDAVSISMGYAETGVRKLGDFVVDKVSGKCLPYSVSISGKAAALGRAKTLKENKERHWDKKSVKDIVTQLAGELGLSAKVDGEIGAYVYPWFAQEDETNAHVLSRLERRHNGLFTIKGNNLIFAKRGSGLSSSGVGMGSVVVVPSMIILGSCTYEANDRTKYKKVVAYHQDKDKVERVEIEQDADADGEAIYRLPEPFASVEEADKAAAAKAKDLKRGEGSAKVTVVGDSSIVAGVPLRFSGVRPQLDGVPYVIDTATHTFSKTAGYRTEISAKLYDGSSGGSGGGSGGGNAGQAGTGSTPGSSAAGGKSSPLAGGTSAPSGWDGVRNYGSTDAN